ncbi:hypothetical protein [Mesorhizobium sp. IMUNJ 23232]|uniref:hypothetical protein n=1 Tax=Mesorhizobium sp. IMUNJ 23232 TaxID=3376064 RepID=UPI0037ACB858
MTEPTRSTLSDDDVKAIESDIDASFAAVDFPNVDDLEAQRLVCTLYEIIYLSIVEESANKLKSDDFGSVMSDLIIRLDALKYAFRNRLRLASKSKGIAQDFRRSRAEHISTMENVVSASLQYERASRIFYEYHNGGITLYKGDDDVIYTSETEIDTRFHALEFSVHAASRRANAFTFFVLCFVGNKVKLADGTEVSWREEFKSVASRATERKGLIRYNLITVLAKPLYETFLHETELLIDSWYFPWGNMQETASFFASLSAIGLYHLISIHEGAKKARLDDGGAAQICYINNIKNLETDICRISGLSIKATRAMIEAFTYGHMTRTPDPVLQPLMPIGNDQIAFPSTMFLSSNWPRNVLSLHARVSPATFDAHSEVFEKGMIAGLTNTLEKKFDVSSNVFFSTPDGPEEVDLVVKQRDKNTALLCELRWMLQPGDPGEVQNRLKAIRRKVSQIDRKYERINRAKHVKSIVYLPIVIIDGYGGIQSPVPTKIPIVNMHILEKILDRKSDIEFAHAFLCTPNWLPRLGRDFEIVRDTDELCGISFSQTGIRPMGNRYVEESLDAYIDEIDHLTVDEIKSIRWPH